MTNPQGALRKRMLHSLRISLAIALILLPLCVGLLTSRPATSPPPSSIRDPASSFQVRDANPRLATQDVVFWHFWGGADGEIVQSVIDGFNQSQSRYRVRGIAMPGNNLDLKLFLSVTGGSPPDLINQDDPILGDWVSRGALTPIDEIIGEGETRLLADAMFPTARRLGMVDGRMFAVCNGVDIRAIYYNRRLFEEQNLSTPQTLPQLDDAAQRLTLRDANGRLQRVGFLPDSRRLWAWGAVFGSDFLQDDQTRAIATGAMGTDDKTTSRPARVTVDEPSTIAAARWMATYADRYGPRTIAAFRSGDQSLPGKSFPLLANRYAMILDGQWRVRDIANAENPDEYGVMPLPPPPGGRRRAGWLNGNYFIIPRGAAAADGSIAFIKYWIGYTGELSEATEDVEEPDELSPRVAAAADTAVRGGWIPVLPAVANHAVYQRYLDQQPLMRQFIDLAASESQIPYPNQPGTAKLRREIELTGARIMMREVDPETALQQLSEVIHPNGPTLSAGISANEKRQRPAGNH